MFIANKYKGYLVSNTKNHYNATIGNRDIDVDIFDLPYIDFDAKTPLIIKSDVVMSDQSRTTNLENVIIIGDFDFSKQGTSFVLPKRIEGRMICQSLKPLRDPNNPKNKVDLFNESFIFPDGITEIDCTHTIKDFEYFIGRLPSTVKKIIVADSMITGVSSDPVKMESAVKLLQKYPELNVVGNKKKITLSDEIVRANNKPVIEEKPQTITKTTTEKTKATIVANQTDIYDSYWPKTDAAYFISADKYVRSLNMPFDDIKLVVDRMWRYFPRTMVLYPELNTELSCISSDDFFELYNLFVETLEEAEKEAKEEATKEQIVQPEEPKPVPKVETPKPVAVEPTPVIIKKYIPKKLWNDITKLCGNKTQTVEFVLNTIHSVNTDINKTESDHVLIIDTEKKTTTPCGYIKKESGNCLVQSVDAPTSNDRKRIVWTYLPKEQILACISAHSEHFCSSGQNKSSLEYKANRTFAAKGMDSNGEKITLEKIQNEKYFDVDILLEFIKAKELLKTIQINDNQNQK